MGLSAAMQAGVSGLAANSTALSAISNNIANVNTTAYKRVRTDFQAIVTASSTPTGYNAGGVTSTTRHMISTLGTLQKASSELDLGIDGQGFFVTTQTAEPGAEDARLFTRDGSFYADEDGYLRNASNLYLQGWPIVAGGGPTLSAADLSQLRTINVENIAAQIEPTSYAQIVGNLNSNQTVSDRADDYAASPTTLPMAAYDASAPDTTTSTRPDYDITIPVSDSQGGERKLTVSLIKLEADATATPPIGANTWAYEVWSPDVVDPTVTPATEASTHGIVSRGRLVYGTDGKLSDVQDPTGASTGATQLNLSFNWRTSIGVAPQTVAVDFNGDQGGLTQLTSASTSRVDADGTPFSGLDKVQVSKSGLVTAVFMNGSTRDIAQLALATFVNADGLTPVSGNAYTVSNESGPLTLKVPGVSGAGLLGVGTLEASDVDLSEEFTNLIVTQRAYSANSRTITTSDEMLQELLNIKR
ncbi:flagellar hook protein FlgE [Asticcacaulis sp. AND118]|uniref:flagellar hook protein FlgE n=1 Tax=Asticcacaulis sp. AND118 TaxID=2840468 RepID=UPI001CFFD6B3|nr:flagellar hook protein FlgE [Asticcacaulis sp. AND118]UDF03958.1 flagellar hook protein FlgE [Asticcacaulis sp. AND118]